jgi:hypothetical protein
MANQEEYDRDRMKLAEVKLRAAPLFTFGSFEPLLGPIILDKQRAGLDHRRRRKRRQRASNGPRMGAQPATAGRELGRVFNFKQVGGRGNDKGGHTLDGATYFEPGFAQVRAEYERMGLDVPLDSILTSAWTEGRENAGWRYDGQRQNWRRADGSVVVEDDGGEWL